MSAESVETILSRAMSDPAFADLLFSDADQAIGGYDLTADEVANLRGISRADFAALATAAPEDRRSFALFGTDYQHNETILKVRR